MASITGWLAPMKFLRVSRSLFYSGWEGGWGRRIGRWGMLFYGVHGRDVILKLHPNMDFEIFVLCCAPAPTMEPGTQQALKTYVLK